MSFAFSLWCAIAIGFTFTAMLRGGRRRSLTGVTPSEPLTLIRPVDAPTPVELQNLSHLANGVDQYVLSPIPSGSGTWLLSDPRGFNRKLGHIHAALAQLGVMKPVLIVDADVRVDDALVNSLVAGLQSGAALAWASPAPVESGFERGLLVQSSHSFEVLDGISPGASPLCGKAMALSPQALEVLRSIPDCVGEDLELSKALHRRGLTTKLVARANIPGRRPLEASYARFTRWMQVLRAHRGALFPTIPLFFACTPLLVLSAAALASDLLLALTALLVLARFALAFSLEGRLSPWWFAGECLLLVSWLQSLVLGSRVTWRGRVLHIGAKGTLEEAPE
ncbi:MAG: glycosyltransferase family 2 protein [Archangium sp.]